MPSRYGVNSDRASANYLDPQLESVEQPHPDQRVNVYLFRFDRDCLAVPDYRGGVDVEYPDAAVGQKPTLTAEPGQSQQRR